MKRIFGRPAGAAEVAAASRSGNRRVGRRIGKTV
jgi:hypothetical protein